MSASGSGKRLSEHQQALSDYLASLLEEVPEHLDEEVPQVEASAPVSLRAPIEPPRIVPSQPRVGETPPPVAEARVAEPLPVLPLPPVAPPVVEPEPAPPVEPEPAAVEPVRVDAVEEAVPVPVAESPQPEWAEAPFPCLLFEVDGLNLAVPLVHLNGILPWKDELTPMPNHQPWFLGLRRHQDVNTKVVDIAGVVVPPERRHGLDGERRPFGNVILIDDARWGLACSAVGEMVTLRPEDVRWRSSRTQRPWLAGTVIKEMCALLDTEALAEMLLKGYR